MATDQSQAAGSSSSSGSQEHQGLMLDLMPQQREVRAPDEDWTGLTSAAERRKLQNRLNNRAWRKRQAEKTAAEGKVTRAKKQPRRPQGFDAKGTGSEVSAGPSATSRQTSQDWSPDPASISPPIRKDTSQPPQQEIFIREQHSGARIQLDARMRSAMILAKTQLSCGKFRRMSAEEVNRVKERFETELRAAAAAGSPVVEQLLRITQFHVLMALRTNYDVLGIRGQDVDMDTVSPFCRSGYTIGYDIFGPLRASCATSQIRGRDATQLPAPLKPTELQRVVPHHPWIDVFPMPKMRDNILRQGEEWDDTELCLDLVECWESPHVRTGFVVWGDPWNPDSWEVSEEFLRKWGWVVAGCFELFRSTNHWRQVRGERLLPFPAAAAPGMGSAGGVVEVSS